MLSLRRCVACVSGDRHLLFELDLVFDWLVLLFESVRDSNGICGLSVVRVKISTKRRYNLVMEIIYHFPSTHTLTVTNNW